ncbi:hypothetical protein [Streptomyces sp. NBC_01180]|uniref:hypothetical protein n=1 Tax=Streptomyces sp. NBC_01180 TaxID=2903763 RepID=UPI00386EA123|nr:hypothetical protein OG708_27145 [Streptomyces sp. NBC_01180]
MSKKSKPASTETKPANDSQSSKGQANVRFTGKDVTVINGDNRGGIHQTFGRK